MSSQSFGFVIVIVPFTAHALSVPLSYEALTVYLKVAEPPPISATDVLSTSFVMFHLYVRLNDGVAVFETVRSEPWQSVTVWLAEPVFPFVLVVKVAVFL